MEQGRKQRDRVKQGHWLHGIFPSRSNIIDVNILHSGYLIQWGNKDFSVIWITMMTSDITEPGRN